MSDFNVRSDSVNVEQIMEQIRERIREKRGVDYTEQQIRELAAVRLEKFLDPRGVRSDLLTEFRRVEPDPNFAFEDDTLFHSTRAPFLMWIRRLLRPVLKLFFNPNPLIQVLHTQSKLNELNASRHQLYYELIHNLVVEATRIGIEVRNFKFKMSKGMRTIHYYVNPPFMRFLCNFFDRKYLPVPVNNMRNMNNLRFGGECLYKLLHQVILIFTR